MGFIKMKHRIKKIYSILNSEYLKNQHEYKLKIEFNGINIYPSNNNQVIYNLHSLIEYILSKTLNPSIYIDFENGYIRII